ncbi:MAG TPA: DUF4349 domain-containing protein [Minicystis sp.]|nr:DUF4349 domain-containing protein [Minicystis sp.]
MRIDRGPRAHARSVARHAILPIVCALAVGCGGAMPETAPKAPPAEVEAGTPAPPPPPAPAAASRADTGGFFGKEELGGARELQGKGAPQGAPGQAAAPPPAKPKPAESAEQPVQQLRSIIIYSAELRMAVFEVDGAMKRIEALAKDVGGYLAKREDTTIVIRVPAERFEQAERTIEKMGDLLHRNILAEDVTEEYRDLEVRLRGMKAVQERLTQLLARAQKVEDSIAIERELDRVTLEIDRIEGRMKYLRDRAAFSTITVTFQPKSTERVGGAPFRLPTPWLNELGLSRLFQL